jgi:hypothetical protein
MMDRVWWIWKNPHSETAFGAKRISGPGKEV